MRDWDKTIKNYISDNAKRNKLMAVVVSLSLLVSFCVPMILTEPAISMTKYADTPVLSLGNSQLKNAAENDIRYIYSEGTAPDNFKGQEYISDVELLIGNRTGDWTDGCTTVSSVSAAARRHYLLGLASDFCLFLENNFVPTQADAEGRAAVGGSIYFNGTYEGADDCYQIGAGDYANSKALKNTDNYTGITNFAHVILGNKAQDLYGTKYDSTADALIIDWNNLIEANAKIIKGVAPFSTKNFGDDMADTDDDLYKRIFVPTIFDINDNNKNTHNNPPEPYQNNHAHKSGTIIDEEAAFYQPTENQTQSLIDFDSEFKYLRTQSEKLSEIEPTGTVDPHIGGDGKPESFYHPLVEGMQTHKIDFDGLGGAGQVNEGKEVVYFNIDGAVLNDIVTQYGVQFKFNNIPTYTKNGKEYTANIIINVSGESINLGNSVHTWINGKDIYNLGTYGNDFKQNAQFNNKEESETILYNFYEATDLVIKGNFNGTLLAPNADARSSEGCPGHLSGALIAKSFVGGMEFGYRPYRGPASIVGSVTGYTLAIDKLDDATSGFLKDAKFKITGTVNDKNYSDTFLTGDSTNYVNIPSSLKLDGSVDYSVNDTKTVTYTIEEEVAPDGYAKSSDVWTVTVEEKVTQVDVATEGENRIPVAGDVKFTFRKNGELSEEVNFSFKDIYSYDDESKKNVHVRREIEHGADTYIMDIAGGVVSAVSKQEGDPVGSSTAIVTSVVQTSVTENYVSTYNKTQTVTTAVTDDPNNPENTRYVNVTDENNVSVTEVVTTPVPVYKDTAVEDWTGVDTSRGKFEVKKIGGTPKNQVSVDVILYYEDKHSEIITFSKDGNGSWVDTEYDKNNVIGIRTILDGSYDGNIQVMGNEGSWKSFIDENVNGTKIELTYGSVPALVYEVDHYENVPVTEAVEATRWVNSSYVETSASNYNIYGTIIADVNSPATYPTTAAQPVYRYDPDSIMFMPLPTSKISFTNGKGFTFEKVYSDNGNLRPLTGASIVLHNESDEVVNGFTWNSNKSSADLLFSNITAGTLYHFEETSAPGGYDVAKPIYIKWVKDSNTPPTINRLYHSDNKAEVEAESESCEYFDLNSSENFTLQMEDAKKVGVKINLEKVDKTTDTLITVRGDGTKNAKFDLFSISDTEHALVTGIQIKNDGTFELADVLTGHNTYYENGYLKPGTYYLHETAVPTDTENGNEYATPPNDFYFTVSGTSYLDYAVTAIDRPTYYEGGDIVPGSEDGSQTNEQTRIYVKKDHSPVSGIKKIVIEYSGGGYSNVMHYGDLVNDATGLTFDSNGSYTITNIKNSGSGSYIKLQHYGDPKLNSNTITSVKFYFADPPTEDEIANSLQASVVTGTGNDPTTIKIPNKSQGNEVTINLEKKWTDETNKYDTRPEDVVVQLMKSTNENVLDAEPVDLSSNNTIPDNNKTDDLVQGKIKLRAVDSWKLNGITLEHKENGNILYYFIKEADDDIPLNYVNTADITSEIKPTGDLLITNTLKTINITANKTWSGNPSDTPDVTVKLMWSKDNGTTWNEFTDLSDGSRRSLSSSNGYSGTYASLPADRTYKIEEVNVPQGWKIKTPSGTLDKSGTLTIENERDLGGIKIQKLWSGDTIQNRPGAVYFKLFKKQSSQSGSSSGGGSGNGSGSGGGSGSTENGTTSGGVAYAATSSRLSLYPSYIDSNDKMSQAYTDYARALQYSLYFYDANMCGDDVGENAMARSAESDSVRNSLVEWRTDCHTDDAVQGGYHDAGDHVMFGLPQGFTASTLGWSYYEFKDGFNELGLTDHYKTIMDRFCDFFNRSVHYGQDGKITEILVQKGNGEADHEYWGSPELQPGGREIYWRSTGSDIAAEYAAALALSYLNFYEPGSDEALKYEGYLATAKKLYEFAVEKNAPLNEEGVNRQPNTDYNFYRSDGCQDDIAWAAVWLALATSGSERDGYISDAKSRLTDNWANDDGHCWNNVKVGASCAYASHLNDINYHSKATDCLNSFLGKCSGSGYKAISDWGSARYNTLSQLVVLAAAKNGKGGNVEWCKGQMEYLLGHNTIGGDKGTCFVTGFLPNSSTYVHHRGASVDKSDKNATYQHLLIGALAGGPNKNGGYTDVVDGGELIWQTNEVALDYNAGLVGAAAGLYHFYKNDETVNAGHPINPNTLSHYLESDYTLGTYSSELDSPVAASEPSGAEQQSNAPKLVNTIVEKTEDVPETQSSSNIGVNVASALAKSAIRGSSGSSSAVYGPVNIVLPKVKGATADSNNPYSCDDEGCGGYDKYTKVGEYTDDTITLRTGETITKIVVKSKDYANLYLYKNDSVYPYNSISGSLVNGIATFVNGSENALNNGYVKIGIQSNGTEYVEIHYEATGISATISPATVCLGGTADINISNATGTPIAGITSDTTDGATVSEYDSANQKFVVTAGDTEGKVVIEITDSGVTRTVELQTSKMTLSSQSVEFAKGGSAVVNVDYKAGSISCTPASSNGITAAVDQTNNTITFSANTATSGTFTVIDGVNDPQTITVTVTNVKPVVISGNNVTFNVPLTSEMDIELSGQGNGLLKFNQPVTYNGNNYTVGLKLQADPGPKATLSIPDSYLNKMKDQVQDNSRMLYVWDSNNNELSGGDGGSKLDAATQRGILEALKSLSSSTATYEPWYSVTLKSITLVSDDIHIITHPEIITEGSSAVFNANKNASWSVEWADSTVTDDISNYVTITPATNSATATVSCKAYTNNAIIVKASVTDEEPATATVSIASKDIAITNSPIEFHIGQQNVRVITNPEDGVTFSVPAGSIVSIAQDGKITAKVDSVDELREITVTATRNGKTATGTIKVVPALSITPATLDVGIGQTGTLTASNVVGNVTWKSSDENVATVDGNGNVTGVANGTVTITATDEGGSSATCSVVVSLQPAVIDTTDWTQVEGLTAANISGAGAITGNSVIMLTPANSTGDNTWSINITGLDKGYDYLIVECDKTGTPIRSLSGNGVTYVPTSYDYPDGKLLGDSQITLSATNTKSGENPGVVMPSAGGTGTKPYTAVGITIIGMAMAAFVIGRRKSGKDE